MSGEDDGNTQSTGGSGTVGEVSDEQCMMNVTPCAQPKVDPQFYYRMASDPRGYCLIFNVFEFPNTTYNIRNGSVAEAKRLSEVFKQLHFISETFDNPSKSEIEKKIDDFAKKPELKQHDCIVVIVLSHGLSGGFIGSDGQYLQFKKIVEKLNNKHCSYLINKPKLFFFSCCRGNSYDYGIEHSIQALDDMNINVSDSIPIVSDADSTQPIKEIVPIASDIMICYSTVDGYVSWRCELRGTWLGQALCTTLLKHSHDKDLHQMLTIITNRVNTKQVNGNLDLQTAKQVIEVIYRGFKKTFYFNPGHKTGSTVAVTSTLSGGDQSIRL